MYALLRTRTCLSWHEQDASPEKYIYILILPKSLCNKKHTYRRKNLHRGTSRRDDDINHILRDHGVTTYCSKVYIPNIRLHAHTHPKVLRYIHPPSREKNWNSLLYFCHYIYIDRSIGSIHHSHPPSSRWRRTGEPTSQHRTPPSSNINSSSFLYQK